MPTKLVVVIGAFQNGLPLVVFMAMTCPCWLAMYSRLPRSVGRASMPPAGTAHACAPVMVLMAHVVGCAPPPGPVPK